MAAILRPSQTIDRRFRILRELGSGGSGTVFQVEDLRDGVVVALKVLIASGRKQREKLLRFRREFRSAATLDHPNIVRVFEFVTASPSYFTMEYVAGMSVSDYLVVSDRRPEALNHPRRLARLFSVLHQITAALAYVHSHRIVHRDLKPENILVYDAPGGGGLAPMVKLMDFGLARDLQDSVSLTLPGVVLGTLAFIAPEQAAGQPIDARTDLYALGVILYRLLTGTLPFTTSSVSDMLWKHYASSPDPLRTRNPDVHRQLERICLRLLEKEPSARYQTAAEVGLQIERAAGFDYALPDEVLLRKAHSDVEPTLYRSRLVGRSSELRTLGERLDGAARGAAGAVVITGEMGSGRSRLLREMLGRSTSLRILFSRCLHDDPRPMGGLRLALHGLADWLHALSAVEARRLVGTDAALLAHGFPELTSLDELRPASDLPETTPDGDAVVQAVVRLLSSVASVGAMLVVVDDVDRADAASLAVLESLRVRCPSISIIATAAPVAGAKIAARLQAEVLPLSPIGLAEIIAIMRSMLAQEDVPAATVALVHGLAGDRPGYVEELVRGLVDGGALVRRGARWADDELRRCVLEQQVRAVGLGRTVGQAIQRRIDALKPAARELLEGSAILGGEASFALLVAASREEEDQAIDSVDALMRAGLMVEGHSEGLLALSSELVEEALHGNMTPLQRGNIARRLAMALRDPDRREAADPGLLARLDELASTLPPTTAA